MSYNVFWLFPCRENYNLQFIFFARVGVKIRKGIPRYLRVLRKIPFNGIEITFQIRGNEGMSVTVLNFQRFSRSLVVFRPFLIRELRACARASYRYDVGNGIRSLDWSIPVNFF